MDVEGTTFSDRSSTEEDRRPPTSLTHGYCELFPLLLLGGRGGEEGWAVLGAESFQSLQPTGPIACHLLALLSCG